MSDDYYKDYNDGLTGNPIGDRFSPGYVAGENNRAAGNRRRETYARVADQYRRNPLRFVITSIGQTLVASAVMGLLGAGLALINQQPPLEWGLTVSKWTALLFLVVFAALTLGLLLGYALKLVLMPFVLWRWMLAFGGISAGGAYVLATMANHSRALAQHQAFYVGIRGVAAGLVVGMSYRLIRLTRRKMSARRQPIALR